MTLHTGTRWTRSWTIAWTAAWTVGVVLISSLAFAAGHAGDKKDKAKPEGPQTVDSGSFGVFIKGQRVVTETFHIEQLNGNSVIKSQLKETGAADPTSQKSDLQLTSSGELLRYEWSQASGGSLVVIPNNDFLMEKVTAASSGKTAEKPFLMPSTSSILDNNFFVQREVLAWRYLAAACKPESGNLKCQQDAAQFGVLVPQDQTSLSVRLLLVGKEKVMIRGVERELLRLNLSGESFEWGLWLDDKDHFKLIRVAIPADNTEVVRD
ncbi:MAG TPA: hypothetical protein VFE61_28570 [Candidatus Sulfotelmatobacter sp.]|nr:hypothetical protein [Candidatus Sulfotelmatobacter sp.]